MFLVLVKACAYNITSCEISDGTKIILGHAFEETTLTSITIPDGVTCIGDLAFAYCSELSSVTIPDSVTVIGDSVFHQCEQLATINYGGTVEEWNAVVKDAYWNSGSVLAQVYCEEDEQTIDL